MREDLKDILRRVRKPYRYIGGEVGSCRKAVSEADIKICLVFPDTYEIGMSHIGLSILYHIVNGTPGMLAERAFAPWADMEDELTRRNIKLFSLESGTPLSSFDIVGISLTYELSYTNVLTVLKQGGIPVRSEDRDGSHPIVVAGGPCTYNPEPMASFFDAMAIGDGEALIVRLARTIADMKKAGRPRREIVEALSGIDGVYVPSMSPRHAVKRSVIPDLDIAPYPHFPVVPYAATQMRMPVEAARGCTHGCRFCQAGYIYRPLRQRSKENAVGAAALGLGCTGHEEFSFLSLSIGDWPPLGAALAEVHRRSRAMPANATLPSLRVESLRDDVAAALGRARSGSFTFAPEAATERMRRFINKGNTDTDLMRSVETVFAYGWHAIKLYFMIGLPGETDEEIEGIVRIANKCLDIGRRHHRRPEITVSTSVFVPKAHTSFQWDPQISIGRARNIQKILKARLKRPGLFYRWHDAEQSFLEGVFSRGGRELARVIELAHGYGARFDAWDDCFDLSIWMRAFAETGIDPEGYLDGRPQDCAFPWGHLGIGPSREFLLEERRRAAEYELTPDCTAACSGCGICDFKTVKNRVAAGDAGGEAKELFKKFLQFPSTVTRDEGRGTKDGFSRCRLHYTKVGRAAFLGHLEATDALRMGLRASGLPLLYSEGYHPRVRIGMGPATAVGVESLAEFVDIDLAVAVSPDDIVSCMRGHLPEGMEVVGAQRLEARALSISEAIASYTYEVDVGDALTDIAGSISRFDARANVPHMRVRGEKSAEVDLKCAIAGLDATGASTLRIKLLNAPPSVRIAEILTAIFGMPEDVAATVGIRKVAVEWKDNQSD